MGETDQMIARYMAEIEERQNFVDGIFKAADGKDLSDEQLDLVNDTKKRMDEVNKKIEPLMEMRRISGDSAARVAELARYMSGKPKTPDQVEYRSAGQYAVDMWRAAQGNEEARQRITTYNRVADHQTTSDNAGLLPEPILGPVLNFIDAARPVVSALGPRQIPSGTFHRPKVTQHTAVAAQSAEKAELTSQAMTITKLNISPSTLGGYVNISRQNLDWSSPGVLDIVINDLAAQYAILTESTTVQAMWTGGTAATVTIDATPTGDEVAAAFWGAAGEIYTAMKGQGRIIAACSPDVLGIVGPLFAPINPTDAQSAGFVASNFGQGAMGAVGGIPVYVTAGFGTTKRLMIFSTAADEVYEDRLGSLQVVEPSVLGLQVAYAGYFANLITEATGIRKVTVA